MSGLESAALPAWLYALEASWLGEWARQSLWLYPLASVVHVLGLALLLGCITVFDLRALGMARRRVPLAPLARYVLTLAVIGFGLQVMSGSVMLAADATHLAGNPVFQVKLGLIALAGLNAAFFHLQVRSARLDLAVNRLPGLLKVAAAFSLSLWLTVAACGRLIAYW